MAGSDVTDTLKTLPKWLVARWLRYCAATLKVRFVASNRRGPGGSVLRITDSMERPDDFCMLQEAIGILRD
jgi:hypothetical protein